MILLLDRFYGKENHKTNFKAKVQAGVKIHHMDVDSKFTIGEKIEFSEKETGVFSLPIYELADNWVNGEDLDIVFSLPLVYCVEEFTLRIDGKDKGRAIHLCIDGFKVLSIDLLGIIVASEGFDSIGAFVHYFTMKHGDKNGVVNVKGKIVHWTGKTYNPLAETMDSK